MDFHNTIQAEPSLYYFALTWIASVGISGFLWFARFEQFGASFPFPWYFARRGRHGSGTLRSSVVFLRFFVN